MPSPDRKRLPFPGALPIRAFASGLLLFLWALASTASAQAQAAPGKRVALVIGNSAYAESPLRNPVNDATDLSAKLRTLGFEVTTLTDRNRSQMTQAIRSFGLQAQGAEAALFYFAGHGMQVRGRNFLLPVGQRFADEAEVENDAVDVNNVLSRIEEAGPRVALLVLDACRNAPLQRRTRSGGRGLARMDAPSGALIAFAAQPGAEAQDGAGRNGTFTKHLLTHIDTPGLAVEQLFKRVRTDVEAETGRAQSPREESSLKADFYFALARPTAPAAPALPGALPTLSLEDLERQQQAREQWVQWQTRQRSDFERTAAFAGSADLQAQAWQRFVDAWKEDNPHSDEDDRLRRQAGERLALARQQAREPAPVRVPEATAVAPAPASAWPLKPLTVVVPFAPGGPTDRVARDLAVALGRHLNTPIVIENVGGAGGTLGASKVARAAPDGYTFLLHHIGMATAPGLYRNLPYRPLEDFEFLGLVNEMPMTLIGRPTLPASNFGELRNWLAANAGRTTIANAGLGSVSHLCGLLLQQSLGVDMTTVPYRGTGPAMQDLLGGQIDLLCDQTTNTVSQIDAGRVKAYAVSTPVRLEASALRSLPTLSEAGMRGFSMTVWHGLYAPKGTPAPMLAAMNRALTAALRDPTFVINTQALGASVIADGRQSPTEHKRFVEQELARWVPVIRTAGQFAD